MIFNPKGSRPAIRATAVRRRLRMPSPAMAVALIALFVALAGSATAAIVITSANIKDGTIRGIDVRNGTLGGLDVRNGSLTGADVKESSLAQVRAAAQAANAGKLDGLDATAFLPASGKSADSDKLDGLDAAEFQVKASSATGGGPNPSGTLQFFGAPVQVTVTDPNQRVLVVASNAFGTIAAPAGALNLFICYQQPPGPVTSAGNGILGLQLPSSTKTTMGLNKVLQLAPGQYTVGMCGTGGAGWSNNDWGTTSALVVRQ